MSAAAEPLPTPDKLREWRRSLRTSGKQMGFLRKARGLDDVTINRCQIGWDGHRYTIPIYDPVKRLVNVRLYAPAAEKKVISLTGHGAVRLYAPAISPSADATVFVVEGEMDCLKASQELDQLWVVSGTGGAGTPPNATELEPLLGRNVVIAYDCDEAGARGAAKLAERLAGIAASVRIADLGLADREDVTDWFVTRKRTASELLELVRVAPPWTGSRRRDATGLLNKAVSEKVDELGSRNAAGFWLACQLRDEQYTRDEAEPVMRAFQSQLEHAKPEAYTWHEAEASLRQVYARPARSAIGPSAAGVAARGNAARYGLIGPQELAKPVPPMNWLICGLWPAGSYGPIGGPKKASKTYVALIAAVALAAGKPAFNNPDWGVPQLRPVVYYGGEGGRAMYQRRLQRIAREVYGVELADIPFYLVTDVGPFDSDDFVEALLRNAEEVEAGLIVMDSLYNYHPASIEVSNLYERGRLLSGLSHHTADRDIALWTVDHFNKTGSGIDLDRLAQSGMAQWADSWWLLEHAQPPDVPAGDFHLSMAVGSRQWGGDEHTIDLNIGVFDKSDRCYLTPIKVGVRDGYDRPGKGGATEATIRDTLLEIVNDQPDQLTKNEVIEQARVTLGVGARRVREAWAELEVQRFVDCETRQRDEAGRGVSRKVWRHIVPPKIKLGHDPDAATTNPDRAKSTPDPPPDDGQPRPATPTRRKAARP